MEKHEKPSCIILQKSNHYKKLNYLFLLAIKIEKYLHSPTYSYLKQYCITYHFMFNGV